LDQAGRACFEAREASSDAELTRFAREHVLAAPNDSALVYVSAATSRADIERVEKALRDGGIQVVRFSDAGRPLQPLP
jgi:hypothetical protein